MKRPQGRWIAWLWILTGWTALALFLGVTSSVAYLSVGSPPRWSLTIRMALAETYVWALLAPVVMMLARRFPFTSPTKWSSLAVHLPASLVISLVKVTIDRLLRNLLFGLSTYLVVTSIVPNFLFYWGIVAAAHGFSYYRSSREKELRASQLEARLAQARLTVLQMQLHPHFLFNTLHTISELVHEDPDTADRMIAGLSELLRETLAAGGVQEVPLHRELELLERYLEIQQARFGDRLRVAFDVDPDVRAALVPHLLLQPVVENAIRHGLSAKADAGRIRIDAHRTERTLCIQVFDDGPGISDDVLEGVGLRNTRERLQGLYGSACHLDLRNPADGGTVVTLTIPFRVDS